jgi:hypothetical protein
LSAENLNIVLVQSPVFSQKGWRVDDRLTHEDPVKRLVIVAGQNTPLSPSRMAACERASILSGAAAAQIKTCVSSRAVVPQDICRATRPAPRAGQLSRSQFFLRLQPAKPVATDLSWMADAGSKNQAMQPRPARRLAL